jgi:hypothetical protein
MDVNQEIVFIFQHQNKALLIALSKEFGLKTERVLKQYHTPYYYMPITREFRPQKN